MVDVKRILYDCDSGVTLSVKPLSPFLFQQLRDLSLQKFPDPDKEAYELPYPKELEPAIPGSKIPAEDNPDYRALVDKQSNKRAQFVSRTVITLACEPHESTRGEVISQFANELDVLRETIELSADVWENTLLYCVITSVKEQADLTLIAESRLPLTPGEVVNGVKFFRLVLSGQGTNGVVRTAPSVQRKERSQE